MYKAYILYLLIIFELLAMLLTMETCKRRQLWSKSEHLQMKMVKAAAEEAWEVEEEVWEVEVSTLRLVLIIKIAFITLFTMLRFLNLAFGNYLKGLLNPNILVYYNFPCIKVVAK